MTISGFLHFRAKVPKRALVFLPVGSLMIGLFCLSHSVQASEGEQAYQQKCMACHTIGGGRLVGPDLKGVNALRDHDWLVRWIVEPDKMLAEGDALAKQLLQEYNNIPMPNFGVSEAEAKNILAYIEAKSGGEVSEPTTSPQPVSTSSPESGDELITEPTTSPAPAGPVEDAPWKKPVLTSSDDTPNIAIGKALYLGQKSFANDGPACITCHRNTDIGGLGGGTLGPDLTKVHLRYGGDVGLTSVLLSTPFPTMRGVFSKKPLLDSEVAHLNAYFAETVNLEEEPVNVVFLVIGIGMGIVGFIILYIFIHLIWRNRLTGVRVPLVGR